MVAAPLYARIVNGFEMVGVSGLEPVDLIQIAPPADTAATARAMVGNGYS
jgi:hypothetical protein